MLFFLCVTLSFQHHFTFSASNPTGLTLRANVDDSPGSPMYHIRNLNIAERIERLINVSNARANYLHLMSSPDWRVLPDNIRIPIVRESLWYAVKFTIGSQRHELELLLDTASGLIWTQCQPCIQCFPQVPPVYDSRASTTYARLPCSHPLCHGEQRHFSCVNNVCVYRYGYAGGASSRGIASTEDFHFFIDQSHIGTYENVIFGCSNDNRDIFFRNSAISGIFGLNFSPESMMQQFSSTIHSRFSYCLVPFTEVVPESLALNFGSDIPELPPNAESTLILQSSNNYHYNLELLDISVGGHRLGLPPSAFEVRAGGEGGCFIDSGTLFTHIDANTIGVNAYERVIQVFRAYYGSRGLRSIRTARGFELCYERTGNFNDHASLTFHFNGADYTVPGQYMILFNQDIFCVAIMKGTFATILGAWSQQNKRIVYDGIFGELQFADENCANHG
ncbi:Atypical Aspartic Protease in Roots 1 [Hibiscus trionum]|nr:Atypical Aspartic Protease in Roots 1 [Hibiscus trionum]